MSTINAFTEYTSVLTTGIFVEIDIPGSTRTSGKYDLSKLLASPMNAQGDLIVYSTAGPGPAKLARGTNGQALVTDSTVPAGVKWASQPFDVQTFQPGSPATGALVLRIPVARAVSFTSNFAGSYAKAVVAATGTATFDVQKNGASVGSIIFSASASVANFVTSGGAVVSLAAGDILSIVAPNPADTSLSDIGFVLAGTR